MTKHRRRGVFITGTDTGVGKTFVSAGLLAGLRAQGVDAVPMKPVQTGCVPAGHGLRAPDVDFCVSAAGLAEVGLKEDLVVPYKFKPACSPHLAAGLAGSKIDLEKILDAFYKLSARHEFVVVEGAGGVMVPLSSSFFMIDLMEKLGLSVILVARAGLGTINHTLLSLNELRRAGLSVSSVFLNQITTDKPGYIEEDNAYIVQERGCVENVWSIPFFDVPAPRAMSGKAVTKHFSDCVRILLER